MRYRKRSRVANKKRSAWIRKLRFAEDKVVGGQKFSRTRRNGFYIHLPDYVGALDMAKKLVKSEKLQRQVDRLEKRFESEEATYEKTKEANSAPSEHPKNPQGRA